MINNNQNANANLPPRQSSQIRSLLFGGLIPIVIFTVVEENYGPVYGTIAAIVYALIEITWEKINYKKVETLTWVSNALIIALGAISIFLNDGIWFKLQPAVMELAFALFLWGSLIAKKNLFAMMAEKQGKVLPDFLKPKMNGITLRLGFFFLIHAGLATWAAFEWSTKSWALLKGAGVTVSMVVYLGAEMLYLRSQVKKTT